MGSPIVNGAVEVKCAGGNAFSTTTSSGAWQVILPEQPLPCAVEVKGGKINNINNLITYHSVTSGSYTANVTPLTDLTVANLAGKAPDAWFAGLADATLTTVTATSVDTALGNLRTALSGLPLSKINPITTKFTATPGDPGDDMLAALQTAMTKTKVSYLVLLDSASTAGFSTAAVTSLNTALPAAYANTISGGVSGTAAQYFIKTAVGNTWSWLWTTGATSTRTIILPNNGVVTFYETSSYGSPPTHTDQIDAAGAWISSFTDSNTGVIIRLVLPAIFTVGTTYATSPMGVPNVKISAFNVTRTVPAGTFRDCLQIDNEVSATENITFYLSPTVGAMVEIIDTHSQNGATTTNTGQLQPGYTANPL